MSSKFKFVYSQWDKLCKEISSKNIIRLDEILEQEKNSKWICIKHDVETNVSKALSLARIEHRYGIKATYYVQANLVNENHKMLNEIKSLGHEVTYHYDVLDANQGDLDSAIKEFKENVEKFSSFGLEVRTVCPHGNPVMIRNGWNSNKDFFRSDKVAKLFPNILDVVVQLPHKTVNYTYISDAGYGFKKVVNIETNDIKNNGDVKINNYSELVKILCSSDNLILSTHPHRWVSNEFRFWLNIYVFKVLRFLAKKAFQLPLLKRVISKYYFLAKKI